MSTHEQVFTVEATPFKFGPGAAREAGWELRRRGVRRALVVTDPQVEQAGITGPIVERIEAEGIAVELFRDIHVEPTAESMQRAADVAVEGDFDGFVGIGGGSAMDTAKVANLVASHPAPIMDYVNPPVGGGKKPPSPLRTAMMIPTTAGTGSEATTVAVLDVPEQRVKSGISHRYMRPDQAIVDPELTRTAPAAVTASAGLDVVCHAAESYLSRPFDTRDAPASPDDRPPYQGANPVADVWSAKALEIGGRYLRRAVADGDDIEARGRMMLAATMAGVGFGSAGVHIPHACAYPTASLKHEYTPEGYPVDHPLTPHGYSVIVFGPASFRRTFRADPDKHRHAAELLVGDPIPDADEDTLPRVLLELMRDVGAPLGAREFGFSENDVPELVEGALKQQRLLAVAPMEVGAALLEEVVRESLDNHA